MSLSMYDVCIPQTLVVLDNMSAIIDKAIAHCAARKIDPSVIVNYRLAADMLPFARQIQIMTDQVKGMAPRLAGAEVPSYADTEVTLEDLKARIAKTRAFVAGFKSEQLQGSEDKEIVLKFGPREITWKGLDYVLKSVFPNFYFHATTAYNILRHIGVEVGKRDFLGW